MSLYSRMDRVTADLDRVERKVDSISNAPQSQRTSVEGGSVDFNDEDGNLKAIVGAQDDGGYTTNVVSGPTPPTPTNFTVEVSYGGITVHWDGEFENDAVAPSDWSHWSAYAQAGQFVTPSRETDRGGGKAASGGEVVIGVEKGTWTVTVVAWSQAGIRSAMAAPVTVEVPGYGEIVLEEIDAANTTIKNAGGMLIDGQKTLGEKLAEAMSSGGNNTHFMDRAPTSDDPGVLDDSWFVGSIVDSVWVATAQFTHDGAGWRSVELSHEMIASVSVGSLVAGTAAIKEAVVQKLFAEVVVARMAVADEFIGSNAILDESVTAPKIVASEELWAKLAQFVTVRAEMVDADLFIGRRFEGVDIVGSRFTVLSDEGDIRTQLSPEGNTFKGEVEADTLVVNGGAEFRSVDNMLAQGAKLTLAAGVTDPTAPPTVQPYWEGVEFDTAPGKSYYGLAFADGKYWTFEDVPQTADGDRVVSIDPTTGAIGDPIPMTDNFWAPGGVTAIGSELFLLGPKSGADYKYFVRVYSTAGVFLREWEYPELGYSKTSPLVYKPGIGTDGTNVVIAQCDDAGLLRIRIYNKTTGVRTAQLLDDGNTKSDITGVYVGDSDWGRKLATVGVARTSELLSFSPTTGAYDGDATKFTAAANGSTGVVFVDGKLRTLDPSGTIHEYADANTGDGSGDWWCAYRWETDTDSDGTIDYRSKISPPARFTWPRRARLKATGQPKPVGVELMAGFLAKKSTKPARTDFKRNYTGYSITRSIAYWDWYQNTGDAPADGNTYPTATPSSVASASNTFEVKGDGSGRWGPLTFNADGAMAGIPKMSSGAIRLTPVGSNQTTQAAVTFPTGMFSTPPNVVASASSAAVGTTMLGVSVSNVSKTSFNAVMRRTDTAATTVYWIAMGE